MTIEFIKRKTYPRWDNNPITAEYQYNTDTGDILEVIEEDCNIIGHADTLAKAKEKIRWW